MVETLRFQNSVSSSVTEAPGGVFRYSTRLFRPIAFSTQLGSGPAEWRVLTEAPAVSSKAGFDAATRYAARRSGSATRATGRAEIANKNAPSSAPAATAHLSSSSPPGRWRENLNNESKVIPLTGSGTTKALTLRVRTSSAGTTTATAVPTSGRGSPRASQTT